MRPNVRSGFDDIGADDGAGENDPDRNSNTNQETIISDQVPNNKDTLAVSDAYRQLSFGF